MFVFANHTMLYHCRGCSLLIESSSSAHTAGWSSMRGCCESHTRVVVYVVQSANSEQLFPESKGYNAMFFQTVHRQRYKFIPRVT